MGQLSLKGREDILLSKLKVLLLNGIKRQSLSVSTPLDPGIELKRLDTFIEKLNVEDEGSNLLIEKLVERVLDTPSSRLVPSSRRSLRVPSTSLFPSSYYPSLSRSRSLPRRRADGIEIGSLRRRFLDDEDETTGRDRDRERLRNAWNVWGEDSTFGGADVERDEAGSTTAMTSGRVQREEVERDERERERDTEGHGNGDGNQDGTQEIARETLIIRPVPLTRIYPPSSTVSPTPLLPNSRALASTTNLNVTSDTVALPLPPLSPSLSPDNFLHISYPSSNRDRLRENFSPENEDVLHFPFVSSSERLSRLDEEERRIEEHLRRAEERWIWSDAVERDGERDGRFHDQARRFRRRIQMGGNPIGSSSSVGNEMRSLVGAREQDAFDAWVWGNGPGISASTSVVAQSGSGSGARSSEANSSLIGAGRIPTPTDSGRGTGEARGSPVNETQVPDLDTSNHQASRTSTPESGETMVDNRWHTRLQVDEQSLQASTSAERSTVSNGNSSSNLANTSNIDVSNPHPNPSGSTLRRTATIRIRRNHDSEGSGASLASTLGRRRREETIDDHRTNNSSPGDFIRHRNTQRPETPTDTTRESEFQSHTSRVRVLSRLAHSTNEDSSTTNDEEGNEPIGAILPISPTSMNGRTRRTPPVFRDPNGQAETLAMRATRLMEEARLRREMDTLEQRVGVMDESRNGWENHPWGETSVWMA